MTGVMPCAIRHSMIADEHGAQHVWRSTLSAPPGTSMANFFFFIFFPIVIQSEAKDLEYIHVNTHEILRHYVPLNDIKMFHAQK